VLKSSRTKRAAYGAINSVFVFLKVTVPRRPHRYYRIESLPDLDEGGRLLVAGPNVMLGYLQADQPGVVKAPVDGWYDTGDIVAVDEDGFVFIRGRAKRFAKIGGEMISLAAVEEFVSALWPDYGHAVIYTSHQRKGEQLVLLTENKHANTAELLAWARDKKIPEIAVPKVIVTVNKLPLAGSGKLDYVSLKDIAEHRAAALNTL
jgi:acyl-[acyl-carrier-protein]-phospholipid O-acyltransferase/long-chain-fatty-acid--[acyl-carrier-protein] ligase